MIHSFICNERRRDREMSESNIESLTSSISALPEGCVSDILSKTSPRDACRAASISRGFNSAADSNAVWEWFLPSDYREIIARAVPPVVFDSKKELYHRLSDPYILLDHGHLGFKIDKESGKKCYMLGARGLSICWSDVPPYWEWGHVPESRFAEVAILRNVCWLDIYGKITSVVLSRKTTYAAYLVFRIARGSQGLSRPGKTMVSFGGVRNETCNVCLQLPRAQGQAQTPAPTRRNDGWMEIKMGEFFYDDGDEGYAHMRFEEHDNAWKNGLIVEGIELRPKQ